MSDAPINQITYYDNIVNDYSGSTQLETLRIFTTTPLKIIPAGSAYTFTPTLYVPVPAGSIFGVTYTIYYSPGIDALVVTGKDPTNGEDILSPPPPEIQGLATQTTLVVEGYENDDTGQLSYTPVANRGELTPVSTTTGNPYVYLTSGWATVDAQGNTSSASGPPPSGQTGYVGVAPPGIPLTAPLAPPGTLDLGTGTVGKLIVAQDPWNFTGTSTLDELDSSGTVTGPSITANKVVLSGNASVDLLNVTQSVQFGGSGETFKLEGATPANINVSGFVDGDVIDVAGKGSLTLSTSNINPGVTGFTSSAASNTAKLWDAQGNLIAQFTFDKVSPELEPRNDGHGGTEILIGHDKPAADPVGYNINWNFVHEIGEGGVWDTPYVPLSGVSGITIGAGVDLGNGPLSNADNFAAALPDADYKNNPNLAYITKGLGVKGNPTRAAKLLGPNVQTIRSKTGVAQEVFSNVVDITDNQSEELTLASETPILNALANNWNTANPNKPFSSLP